MNSDLCQFGSDRMHGREPGQGGRLVRASQHHGVSGVRGVQLQLSGGEDKKSYRFNLSVFVQTGSKSFIHIP